MTDNYSPYCPSCGACGEEGCCPPTRCKHDEKCMYPYYRNDWRVKLARWMIHHHLYLVVKLWRRMGGYYD